MWEPISRLPLDLQIGGRNLNKLQKEGDNMIFGILNFFHVFLVEITNSSQNITPGLFSDSKIHQKVQTYKLGAASFFDAEFDLMKKYQDECQNENATCPHLIGTKT